MVRVVLGLGHLGLGLVQVRTAVGAAVGNVVLQSGQHRVGDGVRGDVTEDLPPGQLEQPGLVDRPVHGLPDVDVVEGRDARVHVDVVGAERGVRVDERLEIRLGSVVADALRVGECVHGVQLAGLDLVLEVVDRAAHGGVDLVHVGLPDRV